MEKTEQTCVEELRLLLNEKIVDWKRVVNVVNQAREQRRQALLKVFPPYLAIFKPDGTAVSRRYVNEDGDAVYERENGNWKVKVVANNDNTFTAYILGPNPNEPHPAFPCTKEHHRENNGYLD